MFSLMGQKCLSNYILWVWCCHILTEMNVIYGEKMAFCQFFGLASALLMCYKKKKKKLYNQCKQAKLG